MESMMIPAKEITQTQQNTLPQQKEEAVAQEKTWLGRVVDTLPVGLAGHASFLLQMVGLADASQSLIAQPAALQPVPPDANSPFGDMDTQLIPVLRDIVLEYYDTPQAIMELIREKVIDTTVPIDECMTYLKKYFAPYLNKMTTLDFHDIKIFSQDTTLNEIVSKRIQDIARDLPQLMKLNFANCSLDADRTGYIALGNLLQKIAVFS